MIKRGHEDDRGFIDFDGMEDSEAVKTRHLYVEEDQLRFRRLDLLQSARSIRTFSEQVNLGVTRKKGTDSPARQRFVLNNERFDSHELQFGVAILKQSREQN